MLLIRIHRSAAVFAVQCLQFLHRRGLQFRLGRQAVARAAPVTVRVNLPLRPRVFLLALGDRIVRISLAMVGRQLAEQQDILRAANAHFGAVLALLAPSEAVGLVVLAHHIGHDRDHAEVGKPVLHVMPDTHCVERLHGRHAHAGRVAEQHAVFDMARKHPAGLEDAQQVGRQIVHLLEKAFGILVMPEIVIAGRVFIVIGKRDGRVDQVNAVCFHPCRLLYAVIIDRSKPLSPDFHSINSYASGHRRCSVLVQAVSADDLTHLALQLVIPLPLLHEHAQDFLLALGADDVDDHLLSL